MDIHKGNLSSQLINMLTALASARFVAFDLEVSGIHSRVPPTSSQGRSRKQTLQERYDDFKTAANKYQVLQIGFTVIYEDTSRAVYTALPYNMFLNPVLEERLEVERTFSFQSTAVEFLLSHGFRMDGPFHSGVPYLSREEEVVAAKIEDARNHKEDIHLRPDDKVELALIQKVREDIERWRNQDPRPETFTIVPIGFDFACPSTTGLNNYHKRLIHQLVRADYQDLVTISQPGCILIKPFNEQREASMKANRRENYSAKIQKQTGIRWFVEAMAGGSLDELNAGRLVKSYCGTVIWVDTKQVDANFQELKNRLTGNRAVLVGHNMFLDLVYFYKCFFGTLPEKVVDFQKQIHELFPIIIDTKYVATHVENPLYAKSSLENLNDAFLEMGEPFIELHPLHDRYRYHTPSHEAGFDSFMTARVLIRLSSMLVGPGNGKGTTGESSGRGKRAGETLQDPESEVVDPNDLLGPIGVNEGNGAPSGNKRNKKRKQKEAQSKSQFAHAGMFDCLISEQDTDGSQSSPSNSKILSQEMAESTSSFRKEGAEGDVSEPDGQDVTHDGESHPTTIATGEEDFGSGQSPVSPSLASEAPTMMPEWDSEFWNKFTNKLCVNGTVEGICDLAGRVEKKDGGKEMARSYLGSSKDPQMGYTQASGEGNSKRCNWL